MNLVGDERHKGSERENYTEQNDVSELNYKLHVVLQDLWLVRVQVERAHRLVSAKTQVFVTLIALDLILRSNRLIRNLLVIWQIWVECIFELLLNFVKLLLHGKNWLEELNKVQKDLLGSQLGQQETEELIIVLIVPWVEGDVHQGEVVVQSIEQEKPVDEGILITLLVPVVLLLSGDGCHCLVDLSANDDEHTVGNRVDLAFDMVHLCRLLNDIATGISLALGIKDYKLIEAHCRQNDRKGDVGDQLE